MYCSECGKPAKGKFCSNCGAPLDAPQAASEDPVSIPMTIQEFHTPAGNWDNEWRYEELIKFPEVRQTIERHTKMAQVPISGEQFCKIADKILQNPVPTDKLAAFTAPIMDSFGIRTGKERASVIDAPIGRGMLRVLCSLARHGQSLKGVKQGTDGCVFECVLPSDPMSLEGDLTISVRRHGSGTEIMATTKIKGQLFDWGKSKRCLDVFFNDLQLDAA